MSRNLSQISREIISRGAYPLSSQSKLDCKKRVGRQHTTFTLCQNATKYPCSPQFPSVFIFVFVLSQLSGPDYLGAWNRLGLEIRGYMYDLFRFPPLAMQAHFYVLNNAKEQRPRNRKTNICNFKKCRIFRFA